MSETLSVTVKRGDEVYERGREAVERLERGEQVDERPTVAFADTDQLTDVFDTHAYRLLRVIRRENPGSIRETARLVDRDVKNVHQKLTTLEALGVIRFVTEGNAKRPVFPYDGLVITPLGTDSGDRGSVPS